VPINSHMKRIPDDQKKLTVNFKIDPDLFRRLQEFCDRRMASRSAAIRRGIEMVMDAEFE
jgi:predicted transcriptional regulator